MTPWLRRLRARLRYRHFEDELRREIDVHRAMAEDELKATGLSTDAARSRTSRVLGNVTLARESSRAVWIAPWLASVWQDLGYTISGFARSPAVSLTAFATLVIGIGLNLSVFTVASGMLLKPWPVPDPDRVALVFSRRRDAPLGTAATGFSPAEYRFLRDRSKTIDLVSIQMTAVGIDGDAGQPLVARIVSDNYFDTLRLPLALGRGFRLEEDDLGHPSLVAVLGYRLWQERYAGAPAIVGRQIRIAGLPFTVIGVSGPGATDRPVGGGLPAVWVLSSAAPLLFSPHGTPEEIRKSVEDILKSQDRIGPDLAGRLRGRSSRAHAQAELTVLDQQFHAGRADNAQGVRLTGTAEVEHPHNHGAARVLYLVFAGLMLLLLLACANVSNLYLARAFARRREITICMGLGASRPRVIRQLLTEGFVLSVAASLVSLLLAKVFPMAVLLHFVPPEPLVSWRLAPDVRVVAGAILLAVVSCVLSSLLPALRSTRVITAGRDALDDSRPSVRSFLLTVQVAISTILLVGSALLARGVRHAATLDPGFDVRGTLAVSVALPPKTYDDVQGQVLRAAILDGAHNAGLSHVGMAQVAPLSGQALFWTVRRPDQTEKAGLSVRGNYVSPDYFEVLRIPLVAGQIFAAGATAGEVVINQTLAAMLWPGGSAVGQSFVNGKTSSRVIGVVRDAHVDFLNQVEPNAWMNGSANILLLPNDSAAAATLKAMVQALEPKATVSIKPLVDNLQEQLTTSIVGASMAGAMGLLALLLATVGTFGVFSFLVVERTREIGVRMAIGAQARDVIALILGGVSRPLGAGLVVGLLASLGAGPLLSGYLYGVSSRDPAAYATVAVVLGSAALAAAFLPAWRAVRINPAIALRHE